MEISIASATLSIAIAVVSWWAWRTLNWVWFKPKMLESYLRRQGLSGSPYTPLVGDLKRNFSLLKEARSKPIKLTDDITPRVVPYPLKMLKTHGIYICFLVISYFLIPLCLENVFNLYVVGMEQEELTLHGLDLYQPSP
uniref:Uncharacterized protein n=2 Tax=Brassica oleracea TaxID=3712 RepID=A0A0D3CK57_BRAOL|nr:unnamed protein product [Brassica oleracea]